MQVMIKAVSICRLCKVCGMPVMIKAVSLFAGPPIFLDTNELS